MYTSKWNIGIDLYRDRIQLVAAKRRRQYWHLCECWQQQLPFELTDNSSHQQYAILLDILLQWRQKLPKKCSVSLALPAVRTIKQQISLPSEIKLPQPELGWYLQSQAEKRFSMHAQELVIDYRVIKQQVHFNAARQSDITFWQNLFAESGFNLLAIDVAPIALRYVARNASLPDECWVIHYRQGEWLWSGPTSQPANYNHLQDTDIPTLSHLLPFLDQDDTPPTSPIYLITDHQHIHHTAKVAHHWELRQAFQQHNIKLPQLLGDFVIAAGLALRHGDI